MSIVHVKRISHVALKTKDVARQVDFYTQMVGLGETERDAAGRVYLRCNADHHSVVLVPSSEAGIDHYALDTGGPTEFEAAATALTHAGIPYEIEQSDELGQGTSLRLRDPDGFTVELISGMAQVDANYGPRAVQPRKLGHITFRISDCTRSAGFYQEVLGFRVSDWVEDKFVWLRCNPDHHGIAFSHGDTPMLHHFAFEVQDFSHLARQADHLAQNGYALIYGPGRHGPGKNLFAYFRDPERNIVEFTCDVQQIWDDATYEPKVWSMQERWSNVWGSPKPDDF
ncbi:MAG TPA: VOC family protein [Ktedonobacteraceae bacterium]|nr:VOC family protein [Ktedonobacteraceae bacterium]